MGTTTHTGSPRPAVGSALVAVARTGPHAELSRRAHARYLEGDATGALQQALEATAFVERTDDHLTRWFLTSTACACLRDLGEHDRVVRLARGLLDEIGATSPSWRAKALGLAAHALASSGRTAQAMELVSEGRHLLGTCGHDGYDRMSATLALCIALQPLRVYELADQLLEDLVARQPAYRVYSAGEVALQRAMWGATHELLGDGTTARQHYLVCASRALLSRRAAADDDSERFARVRADVYEAFALERLGDPDAARGLLLGVLEADLRDDYAEHDLAYLTVGRVAVRRGDLPRARQHFERVLRSATRGGRDVWRACALTALAELEVLEHGDHPAVGWLRRHAEDLVGRARAEGAGRDRELAERVVLHRLRESSEQLSRAALVDPLTGLANRRALEEHLQQPVVGRAAVFVDVDHFKAVNDTWSHEVGDAVLRTVAGLLTASCRAEDLVARFGGDEFVVLTRGGAGAARGVAERLHTAVRGHEWAALAPGLCVTVSVGVAPDPGAAGAVASADAALYAAKRAGRDRVVVHEEPTAAQAAASS
ncbi:diguanylate cyclase [Thalassiella azotivora]